MNGDLEQTTFFPNGGDYKPADPQPSLDPMPRDRGTTLGINL